MIDGENVQDNQPDPMEELAAIAAEQDQPEQPKEGEPADPDPIDVEFGGKQYKIHPDLKSALMFERDYRLKTAELADQRRSYDAKAEQLKAQEAELETRRQVSRDVQHKVAQLSLAEQRLAEFQKVDWNAFRAQNHEAANAAFQDFVMLGQAYQSAARELNDHFTQENERAQQETAKRISEGQAKAAQYVPNWSDKTKGDIEKYAQEKGEYTPEEIKGMHDPRFYRTLYYASVGQKILELAEARKKQPQPEANPPPKMGARQAAPSGDPSDKDDIKTWMEKRNKQLEPQGSQRKANWNGYARS